MVSMPDSKCEALAVHSPVHLLDLCVFWKNEGRLGTSLDLHETRGGCPVPSVDVIDFRIHPHASQHMHGRCQFGERGIDDGIGE
jgi:hypothetical protein